MFHIQTVSDETETVKDLKKLGYDHNLKEIKAGSSSTPAAVPEPVEEEDNTPIEMMPEESESQGGRDQEERELQFMQQTSSSFSDMYLGGDLAFDENQELVLDVDGESESEGADSNEKDPNVAGGEEAASIDTGSGEEGLSMATSSDVTSVLAPQAATKKKRRKKKKKTSANEGASAVAVSPSPERKSTAKKIPITDDMKKQYKKLDNWLAKGGHLSEKQARKTDFLLDAAEVSPPLIPPSPLLTYSYHVYMCVLCVYMHAVHTYRYTYSYT
jgi:hypothetical protein